MSDIQSPWEFLADDDNEADPGEGPEAGAVHEESPDALKRPARDPGRTEVVFEDPTDDFVGKDEHLDDEEPEVAEALREPDIEPDVQELLEQQHYVTD